MDVAFCSVVGTLDAVGKRVPLAVGNNVPLVTFTTVGALDADGAGETLGTRLVAFVMFRLLGLLLILGLLDADGIMDGTIDVAFVTFVAFTVELNVGEYVGKVPNDVGTELELGAELTLGASVPFPTELGELDDEGALDDDGMADGTVLVALVTFPSAVG